MIRRLYSIRFDSAEEYHYWRSLLYTTGSDVTATTTIQQHQQGSSSDTIVEKTEMSLDMVRILSFILLYLGYIFYQYNLTVYDILYLFIYRI